MGLFWNRKPEPDAPTVELLHTEVLRLREEVASMGKLVRTAQAEVAEIAERSYKHLKKAEARARREADGEGAPPAANQGPARGVSGPAQVTPLPQWGARRRRALRAMRPDPQTELLDDQEAEA